MCDTMMCLHQAGGLAGVTAAFFAFHLTVSQALGMVVAVMFVVVGDQVYAQDPNPANQQPHVWHCLCLMFTSHQA